MSISTSTFELEVQLASNELQYKYYVQGTSAVTFPMLLTSTSLKLGILESTGNTSATYTMINDDYQNQAEFITMINDVFQNSNAPYRAEFTDSGIFQIRSPINFGIQASGAAQNPSDADLLALLKLGTALTETVTPTSKKATWQIDFTPPSTISGKSVFIVTRAFTLIDQVDITTEYINFFLRCSSWSQPCNTYNSTNRSTDRSFILSKYMTNEPFSPSSPILAYIPDGPHTLNFEIEQIESSHGPVLTNGLKFVIMLEFQSVAVKHFYD